MQSKDILILLHACVCASMFTLVSVFKSNLYRKIIGLLVHNCTKFSHKVDFKNTNTKKNNVKAIS